MKVCVLVLSLLMVCVVDIHADVQPQRDFNLQRFAGWWYRVGLAYDSPAFLAHKDKLRISMGLIAPQADGSVNLTMWTMRSSVCLSVSYQYERTTTPGHYTYFSTRHNRTKDITVVETNYTEYAVVLKNKKFEREYTQAALYGRSQKLKQDAVQKFKSFAASHGFPRDAIVMPHLAENCPPSAQGNGHGHTHGHGLTHGHTHGHGHGHGRPQVCSCSSSFERLLVEGRRPNERVWYIFRLDEAGIIHRGPDTQFNLLLKQSASLASPAGDGVHLAKLADYR